MQKYFIILMIIVTATFLVACNANSTPPQTDNNLSTEDNGGLGGDLSTENPDNSTDDSDSNVSPDIDNGQEPETQNVYQTLLMSTTNGLNIRSGNSTNYQTVGQINKGDCVTYKGKSGSFYITEYKGKTAYVAEKYVEMLEFETSNNSGIESAIAHGQSLLGVPYELGAQRLHWGNGVLNTNYTGNTYDCSSLVQYMFYHGMGINLDVTSRAQSLQGTKIAKSDLKRGDIMFFTNSSRYYKSGLERIGHVAVYLGDNYILHTASDYAVIEQISTTRWGYYIHSITFD